MLTKFEDTLYIKGIALTLMLCNHLYGMSNLLIQGNSYIGIRIFDRSFESYIGSYGKICVSFFAFLTGIGMFYKYKNDIKTAYKSSLRSLLKLYFTYWVILCTVFIPTLYFGRIRVLSLLEIILNIASVSNTLIISSWYLIVYAGIVFTFPLFIFWAQRKSNKSVIILLYILIHFLKLILTKYGDYGVINYLLLYFEYVIIVIEGYYFAKFNLFDKFNLFLNNASTKRSKDAFIAFAILLIIVLFRLVIDRIGVISLDQLYTPTSIFCLLLIKQNVNVKYLNNIMIFLGKYSTELWFLHAIIFCGSSYIQKIAYLPRYSFLILFWVILLLSPIAIFFRRSNNKVMTLIIKN